MKIFVTGGSGYVGLVLVECLLREGHSVRGLARTKQSAERLTAAGVEPVLGRVQDLDILKEEAKRADAVIHLAFCHDYDSLPNYLAGIDHDVKVIAAFAEALAGSNTLLLGVSDSGVLGNTKAGTESSPGFVLDETPGRRWRCEQAYVQAASQGVRCGVFRLPLHVYGGKEIAPMLMDFAKRDRVARYIGDGSNEATVVHVDDVMSLFILALQKPFPPGTIFNVGDPNDLGITEKMIAEAIAKKLSLDRVERFSFDEAVKSWGFVISYWYSLENVMDMESTQNIFGWKAADGRSFLSEIVSG